MELYLDCNATTPLAPQVVDAMAPFWSQSYGNPSSSHRAGRIAKDAIERARQQVAALVKGTAKQVIFTGSGTEANHLALLGMAATMDRPGTVAVGATEHDSLFGAVDALVQQGWRRLELSVDHDGVLTEQAISLLQRERPQLISVMIANNETGVIQDISRLQPYIVQSGARLHVDATQAAGKIPLDLPQLNADCITLSAHKIHGPKGIGALITKPTLQLKPQLLGGGQERGLRSGTENVPAIVGFGKAAEMALPGLEERAEYLLRCRNHLEQGLQQINGVEIVAQQAQRLPNTVMCLISIMEGETLLMYLDQQGIALSSGSACKVGKNTPNKVLTAMGVHAEQARNTIRISLCRESTTTQIDHFLQVLREVLEPNRALWGAVG